MPRVSHSGARRAHASPTLDRQRAISRKRSKPPKIVLEAVTQEKRKLRSIFSYEEGAAPPGFGFIPVGHPEFTKWCKEQCRLRNLDAHIVSARPKHKSAKDPTNISYHVHRIGAYFPLLIIRLACMKFGYCDFRAEDGLRKLLGSPNYSPSWRGSDVERALLDAAPPSKETIAGSVREMFPKIPQRDLKMIVKHAFKEGTNRVGNAVNLPLSRRIQLAVGAHIRHNYTNYDEMLKTDSWQDARREVEQISLAKLKEWRDELEFTSDEWEETFREIIVLDDDDTDDYPSDDYSPYSDLRETSMEIFSNRFVARDLQPDLVDRTPPLPAEPTYLRAAHSRPTALRREPARTETDPPELIGFDNEWVYNLSSIDNPRLIEGPMRSTFESPTSPVHQHARKDMPPPLINRPSRPVLAASFSPASDQEVILPSIERDPVMPPEAASSRRHPSDAGIYRHVQTPKRQSFSSNMNNPQQQYPEQAVSRKRIIYDDASTRACPSPYFGFVLTNAASSPLRPRAYYTGTGGQAPAFASAGDSSRPYVHENNRSYGKRALEPAEYSAARGEPARSPPRVALHRPR